MTHRLHTLAALTLSAALAACGGGDDTTTPAAGGTGGGTSGGASGTLTLSATTPAAQATTLDLSTATTVGNNTRAADSFSSQPYCEVFWENVTGANGKVYALQVYFRQSDKAPMNVSIIETGGATPAGWAVFDNNNGAAITNITVDTTARTVAFNSKALSDGAGNLGTLAGTASFPANSGTPVCGA